MKDFNWLNECQKAFDKLKDYLSSPLLLSKTSIRETLFIYLDTS